MSEQPRIIPDIGDTFAHDFGLGDGNVYDRTFRVSGWLKRATGGGRKVGPDNCPLEFCPRDEAEYVSGSGVCGVILRAADVTIIGRVSWSGSVLAEERKGFNLLIGQRVR